MTRSFFVCCLIAFCVSCKNEEHKEISEANTQATWSEHIAPIVFKNCTPCHRPGESGPFNLLSYSDAIKKAKLMKFVTQTRYMPPWPADANYTHFIGERVLTEKEIRLIKNWVESDTPRGDSLTEPKALEFYKGSYFGKPDLVVYAQKSFAIKGNGTDEFLIMKFPYEIEKDTLIDFVEFVPDQRKVIHHVNGHLISYDPAREFNYMTGESIHTDTRAKLNDVYSEMHIPYTDKKQPEFPTLTPNVVYYLPGFIPPAYPKEVGGYRFKKHGAFLLNNIHYGPSNLDLKDSSHINVFYRKTPLQRRIVETQLGTFGVSSIEPEFIIPPNEIKTFHTSSTLSSPISVLSVNPHMHLIGKAFWAFALKQNGDTIPLIRINKWDFRWQYYYTYKHPIKLEAGTTIHVYGTYDNTNKNPNNPFHPPQSITQGNGVESMKTTEEMFQFIFTYVPYKEGDEKMDLERR
ncbi:c-type cytochrome [Aurantibacillus circumpalustris]|uniref:c-type cytochrome n=1 Tax=Aurantibacillus circumpalustris TaxID=3036359 RepID=UPI00295C36C7|nr:cytochrome c [Aurantibacillus circumpalustris]